MNSTDPRGGAIASLQPCASTPGARLPGARRLMRQASCLFLFAIAACVPRGNTLLAPTGSGEPAPALLAPYVLQVGDQISVKFYKNPELNEDLVIRPDGMISLQLAGDVRAAGLEPSALRNLLAEKYAHELADPKIAVIVRQLGAHQVHVGGEVAEQGVIPITPGLTVLGAIQEAGGFLETARRGEVVLIRRGPNGQPLGYTLDLNPVIRGTQPEADPWLRPYDIVFVPRSRIANVNLFVKQYVRDVLPIQPGLAFLP